MPQPVPGSFKHEMTQFVPTPNSGWTVWVCEVTHSSYVDQSLKHPPKLTPYPVAGWGRVEQTIRYDYLDGKRASFERVRQLWEPMIWVTEWEECGSLVSISQHALPRPGRGAALTAPEEPAPDIDEMVWHIRSSLSSERWDCYRSDHQPSRRVFAHATEEEILEVGRDGYQSAAMDRIMEKYGHIERITD